MLNTSLNTKGLSLGKVLAVLVLLIVVFILIFSTVFVSVALIAAAIVPLTWVYGLITGQTYDRVCDNSQILYRLNQIGKWTIVIGTALLILKYLLF